MVLGCSSGILYGCEIVKVIVMIRYDGIIWISDRIWFASRGVGVDGCLIFPVSTCMYFPIIIIHVSSSPPKRIGFGRKTPAFVVEKACLRTSLIREGSKEPCSIVILLNLGMVANLYRMRISIVAIVGKSRDSVSTVRFAVR